MNRTLTTAALVGLAAAILLGAYPAQAKPGKKMPILVDKYLHIKDPQALVGPNWDGRIGKAPQVRIQQQRLGPSAIAPRLQKQQINRR